MGRNALRSSVEFRDFVLDLLAPLGSVRSKRMFGGFSLYCGEAAFALIFDDTLYLKADDANRPAFDAAGCPPFTYVARGKDIALSYYAPPEAALEDPDELALWARGAIAAALRQAARARAKPRARPKRRRKA